MFYKLKCTLAAYVCVLDLQERERKVEHISQWKHTLTCFVLSHCSLREDAVKPQTWVCVWTLFLHLAPLYEEFPNPVLTHCMQLFHKLLWHTGHTICAIKYLINIMCPVKYVFTRFISQGQRLSFNGERSIACA